MQESHAQPHRFVIAILLPLALYGTFLFGNHNHKPGNDHERQCWELNFDFIHSFAHHREDIRFFKCESRHSDYSNGFNGSLVDRAIHTWPNAKSWMHRQLQQEDRKSLVY